MTDDLLAVVYPRGVAVPRTHVLYNPDRPRRHWRTACGHDASGWNRVVVNGDEAFTRWPTVCKKCRANLEKGSK
jgi:hypothetical protein